MQKLFLIALFLAAVSARSIKSAPRPSLGSEACRGESCASKSCKSGLTCCAKTKKCVQTVEEGEKCSEKLGAKEGLYCKTGFYCCKKTSVCKKRKEKGSGDNGGEKTPAKHLQDCGFSTADGCKCDSGLKCSADSKTRKGYCYKEVDVNGVCGQKPKGDRCKTGLVCDFGKCHKKRADRGDKCDAKIKCKKPYKCGKGRCYEEVGEGKSCGGAVLAPNQCKSGLVCVRKALPPGFTGGNGQCRKPGYGSDGGDDGGKYGEKKTGGDDGGKYGGKKTGGDDGGKYGGKKTGGDDGGKKTGGDDGGKYGGKKTEGGGGYTI